MIHIPEKPLVSVEWLKENFNNPEILILESKLKPVKAADDWESGFKIPGALMIDVEEDFSDKNIDLPHTLLSEGDFTKAAQKAGIFKDKVLIIYDQVGVYSSPRTWWMFKTMGYKHVLVLNGGLPAWREAGNEIEESIWPEVKTGDYVAKFNKDLFMDTSNVLDVLENENYQILDARSAGRFNATAPEPRPGLRGGHMPGAKNLPFEIVLDHTNLKSQEELTSLFNDLVGKDQKLVLTCGSGVTASILAFAAEISGVQNYAVYDGSWAEWGMPGELPVIST